MAARNAEDLERLKLVVGGRLNAISQQPSVILLAYFDSGSFGIDFIGYGYSHILGRPGNEAPFVEGVHGREIERLVST